MINVDRHYLREVPLFHSSVARYRLSMFTYLGVFNNHSISRIDNGGENQDEEDEEGEEDDGDETAEEKLIRLESERIEKQNSHRY